MTSNMIKLPMVGALGAGMLLGCATTGPSKELQDARAAYTQANSSEAAQQRPDELVDARQALKAAESAHDDDPGSEEERHLAYIAERRSELAITRGKTAEHERTHNQKRDALISSAKQGMVSARSQLTQAQQELQAQDQALAEERAARQKAEAMASAAMEDLRQVAMVKEESRGYVITLSGAVLFKTGQAELLSTARQRLAQVAEALKQQDTDKQIVIEGHTDSRGSDSYNQKLSQERADSVREYLISQGVAEARLQARGVGEEQPIADNNTAEGRANNRRVEIIVSDASGSQGEQGQGPTAQGGTPVPHAQR